MRRGGQQGADAGVVKNRVAGFNGLFGFRPGNGPDPGAEAVGNPFRDFGQRKRFPGDIEGLGLGFGEQGGIRDLGADILHVSEGASRGAAAVEGDDAVFPGHANESADGAERVGAAQRVAIGDANAVNRKGNAEGRPVGLQQGFSGPLVGGKHGFAFLRGVFRQRFGAATVDQPRGGKDHPGAGTGLAQPVQHMQETSLIGIQVGFIMVKPLPGSGQSRKEEQGIHLGLYLIPLSGIRGIKRMVGKAGDEIRWMPVIARHLVSLRQEMHG